MRHRLLPLAFVAIALILACLAPADRLSAQSGADPGAPDRVVLQPPPGLRVAGAGDYVSPPTAAAHPFTHMLVRWEADVPQGAEVALFVRASIDGSAWGEWVAVIENDDLWRESDGPNVEWSQTLDAGTVARFWQVRATFAASAAGARPALGRIDVNTVDASGPGVPAAPRLGTLGSLAKPSVVSRVGWGSPDGEGSRVAPTYYPVDHMVVHHTADSNSLLPGELDWASRVRAEWRFHTYTRGWGDVGYNYLIDPNGVIYEGRAGGDDAVAFHDTANYGSMGVVLIGTYASVPPTQPAQDALVELLGWKAGQKGVDPLGSSFYYGCSISKYCRPYNAGSVVVNIAGHRHVTPGHTTCPGDKTIEYLPGIRERVKRLVSGGGNPGGDNGDLAVDEMESSFARSQANWREVYCGYSGHTYWTYATDGAPENSATWRPTIPSAGRYRVYVHVPQGCGLGSPPYASTQAMYRIHTAQGNYTRAVDHNTATTWADLGVYQFSQGTDGAVELYDNTGEPLSAGRVLFFDAVKWVPENSTTGAEVTRVSYDRTTLAAGELLKVTFTVRNTGDAVLQGQAPRVDLSAGGGLSDLNNGYVYDQDECFVGNSSGSYPVYPKEDDRIRVVLGTPTWDSRPANSCAGPTSSYPWRWGLNADLGPGQEQTLVGYVRFRVPGTYTLQAGLVQEYVKYFQQGVSPTSVTVTSERVAPDAASYDARLQPLARVYRLGDIPDNFLARTQNPLSIPRGEYVGGFAWDGGRVSWGAGGPLGLTDEFVVEQTRGFTAPASGQYTFRTTSDDGSWLWVDGTPVVINNGLHAADDATGTINLGAGVHVVSFKYFERTGDADIGYDFQPPGEAAFRTLPDALGANALRLGATFAENPWLTIVADDQGGEGIDRVRWSWDGVIWQDSPGGVLGVGRLVNGSYRLRYQAIDKAGNAGVQQELAFVVNTNLTVRRVWAPLIGR
jgi:hypothetical protein